MDKKSICCILVCLLLGIFNSGCLDNDNGSRILVSFKELADDYSVERDNDTKEVIQHFQSFDDGDMLFIQDSITNISYSESENYTWIEFSSYAGEIFHVAGDITRDFGFGDTVEIKMHVGSYVFTEENPYTGENWTFDMEVLEEGWDNESHEYIPVPQKYVYHVNPPDKKVTMTFNEFINDFTSNLNNETKIASYWFQSLNDGDTVIIYDTIQDISIKESEGFSNIEFSSLPGNVFSIARNIANEFGPGDTVEIKMHIIAVNFTQRNMNTNEDWTVKMETFREGWDSDNHEYIAVPQKYITHVPEDNRDVIMTFSEFINDYHSNIENESRRITYYFQSLNEGDTLIIRDTINAITYNETRGYTSIKFISYPDDDFPIEGDITDEFTIGDVAEIRVHIISVSFTSQHPSTGETWTFQIETIQEEWDDENKTYMLLPAEYIHHVG